MFTDINPIAEQKFEAILYAYRPLKLQKADDAYGLYSVCGVYDSAIKRAFYQVFYKNMMVIEAIAPRSESRVSETESLKPTDKIMNVSASSLFYNQRKHFLKSLEVLYEFTSFDSTSDIDSNTNPVSEAYHLEDEYGTYQPYSYCLKVHEDGEPKIVIIDMRKLTALCQHAFHISTLIKALKHMDAITSAVNKTGLFTR